MSLSLFEFLTFNFHIWNMHTNYLIAGPSKRITLEKRPVSTFRVSIEN